jgi:MoxR-like ATPase
MNGDTPGDTTRRATVEDVESMYHDILAETSEVLIGNERAIEHLTIGLLTRGHILLEGVPGVAKTTLANLFARVTGLEYSRIQMTPDILPADITGTQVYRENIGEFELQRGPVFANVVVADEINRATPKTQSALLEAMQEQRVTIGDQTLELPSPFIVIATQNPIEMEGTFELPEAQQDRFQFKLTIDLLERGDERALVDRFDDDPGLGPGNAEQVVDVADILAARRTVRDVYVSAPVKEYILNLVDATRTHPDIEHGTSPRATLTFLDASKGRAAINGREYVIPDDVKLLAPSVLVHRLVLSTDADLSDVSREAVIADVLEQIEPPGADAGKFLPADA